MNSVELNIERALQEAHLSGELKTCACYGKPLPDDDEWSETPEAFRMPFKVLKNAGYHPPEIALFHERARLRALLDDCSQKDKQTELQKQLSALDQVIALRLEGMRATGAL